MSDFATLKAQIVTNLETLTDLGADNVFNYEPDDVGTVDKDPFAVVVASDNEADYLTTGENKRVFAFSIRVFVLRSGDNASTAESTMVSIIDQILNTFDNDFTLNSKALMVEAAPSLWEYVLSDKSYRVAEVRIRASVAVTLT